ncbi:MAG TPA: hypothetical protein VIK59_06710 [Verrucomicrobiae bacterium]
MKNTILILAVLLLFPALVLGGEKEEMYLKEKMIPRAQELLLRIAQTNDLPITTNQVQSYKVDFYDDGWVAKMQLTNGWGIGFFTDQRETNESIFHAPEKLEKTYLKETMIPLAQAFLQRMGQTNDLPLETNQIKYYRVTYFHDRPGCQGNLRLTNNTYFSYLTESNKTEIWSFHRPIKTYFDLENPPKEKIEALQAMNLQNKLNKKSAAILAAKYFKILGHKEKDFHPLDFYPPEITQGYWVSESEDLPGNERRLPYYAITWYRKDVTVKELEDNDSYAKLKTVRIEVSGIDLGLISYSKGLMPIGSDF